MTQVIYSPTSKLVKLGDRVVGEVVQVPGGFAYHHYRFGMRNSSALPSEQLLLERVEQYLIQEKK